MNNCKVVGVYLNSKGQEIGYALQDDNGVVYSTDKLRLYASIKHYNFSNATISRSGLKVDKSVPRKQYAGLQDFNPFNRYDDAPYFDSQTGDCSYILFTDKNKMNRENYRKVKKLGVLDVLLPQCKPSCSSEGDLTMHIYEVDLERGYSIDVSSDNCMVILDCDSGKTISGTASCVVRDIIQSPLHHITNPSAMKEWRHFC